MLKFLFILFYSAAGESQNYLLNSIEVNNGAYCKYCVAFTKNEAGVNNQKLGAFVLKKYDDWKHALEDFKNHSNLEYHKKSLLDADNFLNMLKNPSRAIDKIIDNEKTKQILQNRKNIIPIIEAVILCGRQNLALRGHRDSGKIEINDSKVINDKSEGNFREIIRYRAQGDIEMKTYLESSGKMKYTSHRSQNDMIDACNNILLNKVVSRVNAAKCFSILADETADISGVEQVSLCVRYINSNTLKLTEEFLQFVPTNDMTGKGIANLILENLQKFGINTQYLRGQGYDGAAAMAGKFNGVQAHINEIHPNALYVHCSAHSLNLAVSKSCSVPAIRDCLGTISQIRDFFIYPKRKSVLIQKIENSSETSSKKTLKRSCETRWIERYHAVHDFLELFEYVEEALEDISEWNDNDTSEKARRFNLIKSSTTNKYRSQRSYVIGTKHKTRTSRD
ncbi:zinc finger MYM-type protein 1-like [Rhopalosiphum padi]|uniref:zinc finger MYM-type protein 1-like n=1 Tax=Rhopalosiphum padi TaxID=40932 RepID=UPI00298E94BF|nr:zinc finger MYM-type protein 1-like [Rhopalosiphum padi]